MLRADFIFFGIGRHEPESTEWRKIFEWRERLERDASDVYQAVVDGQLSIQVNAYASRPGGDRINEPLSGRRWDNVSAQLRIYFGDRARISGAAFGATQARTSMAIMAEQRAEVFLSRQDVEEFLRRPAGQR